MVNKEDHNISGITKEYYSISELAQKLNCNINDLIHFGINNKLKVAAYININENKACYFYDKLTYYCTSGYYYIDCNILEHLEYNEHIENISALNVFPINSPKYEIDIFYEVVNNIRIIEKEDLNISISDLDENNIMDLSDCSYDGLENLNLKEIKIPKHDLNITIQKKNIVIYHDDLECFLRYEWPTLRKFRESIQQISNVESPQNSSESIHPKLEHTLIKLIGALLQVITGELSHKEVLGFKHPAIINQADLINILNDMQYDGLRTRNLQTVFARAKRAIERA